MKALASTALLVLLVAGPALAQRDPRVLTDVEMKSRAAAPVVIVAPKYPTAALQEKIEGTVDVRGLVLSDGNFDLKQLEGEREDFKSAVKDVIELWRFVPGYGEDCSPRPVESQLRVWFELGDGKPKISVSRATKTPDPPALEDADRSLKAVTRVDPQYPYGAIRAGVQARVEALMLVTEEGEVRRVEIVPSTTHRVFNEEVTRALSRWKFQPRPGGKSVCAIYEINFRLRD